MPGLYGGKDPLGHIEELVRTGLLLALPEQDSGAFAISHIRQSITDGVSEPMLFVPADIVTHLPEPPLLDIEVPKSEAPDSPPRSAAVTQATTDFLEALRIVEKLTPRVTSIGILHKTDAAKAYEMAREAGLTREAMDLSLAMAQKLGCIAPKHGRFVTTSTANEWASGSRPERIRALFDAYLASEALPDIALFFPSLFDTMEHHLRPGTQRRTYHKVLAAELLKAQAPGAWYSTAAFVETIRRLDANVLFLEEPWRAIKAGARDAGTVWRQRAWESHEKRLFTWMAKSLFAGMGLSLIHI